MASVDVFSLLTQQDDQDVKEHSIVESELLFVGSKQAGKSTLIHNFLMKEDAPKPTTALEYRFARRSTGDDKSVANIWELGGGTQLSQLLKVVLLPERLASSVVAITLDLSIPGEALQTLQFWMDELRKQVDACLLQLQNTQAADRVETTRKRLSDAWKEHADRDQVRPLGVPVVVLAHKWDAFEAAFGEAEYRKVLTRTLRYFSHLNGASLVCCKQKDKAIMTVTPSELESGALLDRHIICARCCATCCTITSFIRRPYAWYNLNTIAH